MDKPELTGAGSFFSGVLTYGRMIKFSHTVFALPFALSAVILVQREHAITFAQVFWILVAMVSARSAAMGFNRIVDADIDGDNPRTAGREIPAGRLSAASAIAFVTGSALLFVISAAMLGRLCFYWSVPVLAVLCGYSYTKRFTWLAHFVLGFAISLAPLGVWVALTDSYPGAIVLLSLALLFYITGFDILYACQDVDFDQTRGLFSVPARFGVRRALRLAAGIHALAFVCFLLIHPAFEMNRIYPVAVALIGLLLIVEHRLVKPDDLRRVNLAFFHVNSLISITLFAGVLADEVARRWM